MPATYEPIASTTLSGDASSITLLGIPSSYTDLVAVITAIPDSNIDIGFRINNDSSSIYSGVRIVGNGFTATSGKNSSQSWGYATINGLTSASGDRITSQLHFMSYANTSVYKTVLHTGGLPSSGVQRSVALWMSTSAINRIELVAISGNLMSGSSISLFGIRAA
jgi:hypothetical protein